MTGIAQEEIEVLWKYNYKTPPMSCTGHNFNFTFFKNNTFDYHSQFGIVGKGNFEVTDSIIICNYERYDLFAPIDKSWIEIKNKDLTKQNILVIDGTSKEPLIGAEVLLLRGGKKEGTLVTDIDGTCNLLRWNGSKIRVEYAGYKPIEVFHTGRLKEQLIFNLIPGMVYSSLPKGTQHKFKILNIISDEIYLQPIEFGYPGILVHE